MTRVVGTPLRVTEFGSPSDEAISARVSGDSVPRIRIDAGGRITWGDGSAAGDIKLYRSNSNAIMVDGVLTASLGLITAAISGSPTVYMPNGSLLVDNSNNALYFRSNNQWIAAGTGIGGGNASLTIADTPPADPEEGDLWFESDTGKTFVYYDSFWVETGGGGATGVATGLPELGDVALSSLSNGDFLRYNSSASVWTNDPINLSTDTTGNYVASLVAGTGISLANNSGEGATPTVSIESTAWTSYTPSLRTNGGTVTLGNGSITGAYKLIGKTCHFYAKFTVGSTTSIGANEILIGLPVQAMSSDYTFAGAALDNGNAWYEITGIGRYLSSTTEFAMVAKSTGTGSSSQGVGSTFPFSFLDGDYITISGTYEAA